MRRDLAEAIVAVVRSGVTTLDSRVAALKKALGPPCHECGGSGTVAVPNMLNARSPGLLSAYCVACEGLGYPELKETGDA